MHASHPPRFNISSVTKASSTQAATQAAALRRFLSQVGGLENGRRALDLLAELAPRPADQHRQAA